MHNKIKIIRRKRTLSPARKISLFIILPIFLTIVIALITAVVVCASSGAFTDEQLDIIAICTIFPLLVASILIAFVILPQLNAWQSGKDLEKYDFSDHEVADEEIFVSEVKSVWHLAADPFDKSENITFENSEAAVTFLKSCSQRITALEETDDFADVSIYINRATLDPQAEITFVIHKEPNEHEVVLTATERIKAVFLPDGRVVADKKFAYGEVKAFFRATLLNGVRAEVQMVAGAFLLNFALSGRIAAIIKKYGIKTDNDQTIDFILQDPRKAFRKIASSQSIRLKPNFEIKKKKA